MILFKNKFLINIFILKQNTKKKIARSDYNSLPPFGGLQPAVEMIRLLLILKKSLFKKNNKKNNLPNNLL